MFYIILFSALAVLLVVAGVIARSRQRQRWQAEERRQAARAHDDRHTTKARRAQSRQARRKRH
jgi:hypothetical protein